jgi:LDH2 family malate/lactate/ureidoglycolate dehydrogenase
MDVPIDRARDALLHRARSLGFAARDAALLADHFLDAELCGAPTHGLERLRWLAGQRGIDPSARPRLLERTEGRARYDGAGAAGYIALAEAIDRELEDGPPAARLLVVSHCFPTGRLGYFAERAASRGAVCLLCATSTPRIVHPAGGPPLLGTNPFCLALPDAHPPLVVDVSMGQVTYGEVLTAAAAGRSLPGGAAARPDGDEERDPIAIVEDRAGIRPFGGELAHKGFALAMIVELLCAALAGADGHAAVALLARPESEPTAGMRQLMGGRRMPGAASADRRAAALERGTVTVPDDLWAWITGTAA